MSHAGKADKLLIKPTAGARPASPCTPGRFIRKPRTRGLTPEESRTTQTTPDWQRPLTDRPSDSHRRLSNGREWRFDARRRTAFTSLCECQDDPACTRRPPSHLGKAAVATAVHSHRGGSTFLL